MMQGGGPMRPFRKKTAEVRQKHMLLPISLWRPRGDHSLEGSEAVFGAVSVLSNTLASMRVRLMRESQEQSGDALARLVGYQPEPTYGCVHASGRPWRPAEARRATATPSRCRERTGRWRRWTSSTHSRVEPLRDLGHRATFGTRSRRRTAAHWYIPRAGNDSLPPRGHGRVTRGVNRP